MDKENSNLDWMIHWSLPKYTPRNTQIVLINKIMDAISRGYKNIILEAGTGTGKSAIATTIASMFEDSYILTMTKQLQEQYLNDFGAMLVEIKGRGNYKCNYKGTCDFCIKSEYNLSKCGNCDYLTALNLAKESDNVLTNYDYFYYAGVANPTLNSRELLVLDEAHNLERKMLALSSNDLNREYIAMKFGIDIFEPIIYGKKSVNYLKREPDYWIDLCDELVDKCSQNIREIQGDQKKDVQVTLDEFENDPERFSSFNYVEKQQLETDARNFNSIKMGLESKDFIIDLPDTDLIKSGQMDISTEFKPYSVADETNNLLKLGNVRLFLTGTLGSKDKFCEWNNIDSEETHHIYQKSPFDVSNRPIYTDFVGSMSGRRRNVPRWKNTKALDKIREILNKHPNQKGVIHTSSNEQAFWLIDNLSEYNLMFVGGSDRNQILNDFNESEDSIILVGASIKDGVDFKDDLCRFQIVFKVPYPQLNEQVKYRKDLDPKWYYYQAVMSLMQAYGRGIRDEDDWCEMYIIDSDFIKLFDFNKNFFNEYFSEAIKK